MSAPGGFVFPSAGAERDRKTLGRCWRRESGDGEGGLKRRELKGTYETSGQSCNTKKPKKNYGGKIGSVPTDFLCGFM